jgi:hypothetical protein
VNKKSFAPFLALAVALLTLAFAVGAQTKTMTATATTAPATASSILNMLPPSDVVGFVNVKSLLNDALPKVLADNPAKLAEVNAQIDKVKTQTGVDVRSFENIAVGVRYQHPSANDTDAETVVIAHGTFNANAFIAVGRMAAQGKYREEKYQGATLYIFNLNSQLNVKGIYSMKIKELAVTSLNANTLALGDPEAVRATIDANKTPSRTNNDLLQLATREPSAIIGFSANVPQSLTSNVNVGNEEVTKMVNSIRQCYGAVSTTANGFGLLVALRTETPEQAHALSDTLAALKQFGAMVIPKLPPDTGKIAQNALDSMKIASTGNEASLNLEVSQADITTLMHTLQQKPKQDTGASNQKP